MNGYRIRKRLGIICTWGVVSLLLCSCGMQQPETPLMVVEDSDDTVEYNFATAEKGDVVLTQRVMCTYKQQADQEISFSLTGRLVDKVYVQEGDLVKKGDLLAELSAGNLERQIEDLEYRISRNQLLLEYADKNEELDISQAWVNYLFNGYPFSKEALDESIASIQQRYRYQREDSEDALELDRMQLAKLQQEFQYCRVYAGMDGKVYKLKEHLEDSTSKDGEVIMTIVDNSQCLFEAKIPEYADCFKEGETVSMTVVTGSAPGQYELLPYQIENWGEVQQFTVFSGPTTTGIEVGTNGTMQFVVDSRQQVLCIPKTAVNSADGKYFVYVADEDNMRQVRWVEVGLVGDDMAEILDGLEEGEKVIRK
ncbi:MAG: efflux RND transporter periplasmic adaptor subunit [Acetatifactor sp.]